jgi:LmbE family N-acetylglucosaminyl deacetylase
MVDMEPLQPLDEDWKSALAVVAHPDDMEYGTAAAVARWTAQGKRVGYTLATSGEAGIDGIAPEEAGPLREREQRASAAIVGVDEVEFLGHPDGVLEYGLPLRRDIARSIRRYRPEVVVTGNYHHTWGTGSLNQADHVAVGRSTIDAIRDAANRWVFRELLDEDLPPWNGVRMLLVAGSPLAGYGVDVTDHFAAGVRSLEAHEAYLAGLGGGAMADPEEFLESIARLTGTRLGCRFAVSFEVISFG